MSDFASGAGRPSRDRDPEYAFSVRGWGSWGSSFEKDRYKYSSDYIVPYWYRHPEDGPIQYIYKDYSGDIMTTSAMGADFTWSPRRWYTLCGTVGLNHLWHHDYEAMDDSVIATGRAAVLSVLGGLQANMVNHRCFRLYTSLQIGIGASFGFTDSPVTAEIQLAPLGMEIGRSWFGFAEAGYGTLYSGLRFGVGHRF